MLYQLCRAVEAVQDHAEQAIKLSREQGSAAFLAIATTLYGWALVAQGHGDEGLAQIRHVLAGLRATGAQTITVYLLAVLADAYRRVGQISEGFKVVAEALTLVDTNGERYAEAELYRLQGELIQKAEGKIPIAALTPEVCLQKALSIARHQQAKSWELRAAASLARLRQSQDKHQDAYALLAPVYNWFTEGFDTADLKEAKALLDDLA
jgi:predicted ATPase